VRRGDIDESSLLGMKCGGRLVAVGLLWIDFAEWSDTANSDHLLVL
jgi:hypothetical protein